MASSVVHTDMWWHDGFTADAVKVTDFPPDGGFGVELQPGPHHSVFIVCGPGREVSLAEQEQAARAAAAAFTQVAERLARLRTERDGDAATAVSS